VGTNTSGAAAKPAAATTFAAPGATAPAKTGHPVAFWFFFWGEFAERSSYYGMRAILSLYMVDRLGVDKADAGTFMSIFIACCYFLPLLGGYVADNFLGKYWTIVGFSIPYVVGQCIVGIENKYVVLGSLFLLAMGSGVIKPNISALLGLTYDQERPGQEQLRSNAFSWFYLAINSGALISQLGVPWLRTHYDYSTAFMFPAVLMAMSLTVFAAGKRFYAKEMLDVKVVGDPSAPRAEGRTWTGVPIKYRVVTPEEKEAENRLKLQTLGRIGSLFILVMFFWAVFDQSASTWIFFADTYMDLHLFGIEVTADQIQFVNALFIVTLLPLSVFFFNAMANRGIRIRATDKMIVGFFLTGASMAILAVAGFLAGQKQDAVKLTLKEGEIILPASKDKLNEIKPTDAQFGPVKMDAPGATYNEEKKKWEVTNATISLGHDSRLVIKDGRIDFAKSTGLFTASAIAPSEALETKFKNGKYPLGQDTIIIGDNNSVEVKKGVSPDEPKDKESPKATLEKIDWVKPSERVTAWWEILAYFVLTISEILISVTGLELAFVAAPATMKSFVTACWLLTVGLANLLINASVTRLYEQMPPGQYFSMLSCAIAVVIVFFIPLAFRFNRGMAAAKAAEEAEASKEANSEAI
jgi:POT family proton-dependent oligopeptide transporter